MSSPHPVPSQAAHVIHSFTDTAGPTVNGLADEWGNQLAELVPQLLPWAIGYMLLMWGLDWVVDKVAGRLPGWGSGGAAATSIVFEDEGGAIVRHGNSYSRMRKT
jgi:hypothetical protein